MNRLGGYLKSKQFSKYVPGMNVKTPNLPGSFGELLRKTLYLQNWELIWFAAFLAPIGLCDKWMYIDLKETYIMHAYMHNSNTCT